MHYYIAFMEAAAREKLGEPASRARNWQFSEIELQQAPFADQAGYLLCPVRLYFLFKYGYDGPVSRILGSHVLRSLRIYERDSFRHTRIDVSDEG
jgi:hypothetical protein